MSGLDTYLQGWHPEPLVETEALAPEPARALAAVLETPDDLISEGHPLPALWHWVYFLQWPRHSELGADGHPAEGHFLPPLPDRRRMFAGGHLRVFAPLLLGQRTERTSTLAEATVKHGRSGEMVFVTVRNEFHQDGQLRLVEEQDIVYRSGEGSTSNASTPPRSPEQPEPRTSWYQPFTADPVRLFRFSALTANAHRIHYDQPYARDVEAYPDLVVHGPLLVLLMSELARQHLPGQQVSTVDFRLRRPVFAGDPVLVTGEPEAEQHASMAVLASQEHVAAEAEIAFTS